MSETPPGQGPDQALRFLFEQADIRGELVQLDGSLEKIFSLHAYAPGVRQLLGEFLSAAVLLATNLKFDGKLILQARSRGQIPLLMVECGSDLAIRGIARGAEEATATDFASLLGEGQLAITIDPHRGKRYQGVVPLDGADLASCLDYYFQQSEQLQTRLWLNSDGRRAGGMLVQQLPAREVTSPAQRARQWEHVTTLAATVTGEELLALPALQLLHRLFHEDPLRIFEPRRVAFRCSCSHERTLGALAALGPAEVESILQEQGSVTMDCEFCNQRYIYGREDLGELLDPARGQTLH